MARSKSPNNKPKDPIADTVPTVSTPQPSVEKLLTEAPKPKARKLEVRKADPRKNIVPINLDDEIRRRAYELSEQRGFESGHETEDWLNAEREVLQRYHQRSA